MHVDDDGPGIPADRRADVVRRFVRLDEGRGRDGGGAGLGLAVTSDVVAAHGGRLDIDESPLGGARLSLVLARGVSLSVEGRASRPPALDWACRIVGLRPQRAAAAASMAAASVSTSSSISASVIVNGQPIITASGTGAEPAG